MEKLFNKLLKQSYYYEVGENKEGTDVRDEKYRRKGKHVSLFEIGDRKVKESFCIRNIPTTATIIFEDETYINIPIIDTALYLDCSHKVVDDILILEVDLCWYTLTYEWQLKGEKLNKEECYEK